MATQRAGDQGKPSIHIGSTDTKIAKRLGIEDDSPSTVYSDSLEAREKYEKIKEEDLKDARKEIIQILNDVEDRYGVESVELIGDLI